MNDTTEMTMANIKLTRDTYICANKHVPFSFPFFDGIKQMLPLSAFQLVASISFSDVDTIGRFSSDDADFRLFASSRDCSGICDVPVAVVGGGIEEAERATRLESSMYANIKPIALPIPIDAIKGVDHTIVQNEFSVFDVFFFDLDLFDFFGLAWLSSAVASVSVVDAVSTFVFSLVSVSTTRCTHS